MTNIFLERGTVSDSVIRTVDGVDIAWIMLVFDVHLFLAECVSDVFELENI